MMVMIKVMKTLRLKAFRLSALNKTIWVSMMLLNQSFTRKKLARCMKRGLKSVCFRASGLLWLTVLTIQSIWFTMAERCGAAQFTIPISQSSILLWRSQICTTTLMMTLRSSSVRLSTDLLLTQCCHTTHLKDSEWALQLDCQLTVTLTRAINLSRIEDYPTSGKTTIENSQR